MSEGAANYGHHQMLTHEDLQRLTGYKTPADISVCLSEQGIRFCKGKRGRIWTSISAINYSLGCHREEALPGAFEDDIVVE